MRCSAYVNKLLLIFIRKLRTRVFHINFYCNGIYRYCFASLSLYLMLMHIFGVCVCNCIYRHSAVILAEKVSIAHFLLFFFNAFYCILISFIALVEKQLKLKLFVMMHNKNYNDFVVMGLLIRRMRRSDKIELHCAASEWEWEREREVRVRER